MWYDSAFGSPERRSDTVFMAMPAGSSTPNKPLAYLSAGAFVLFLLAWGAGWPALIAPALVASLALFAVYCQTNPKLHVFTFTFWVFACVAAAMFYPAAFDAWGGYDLSRLIVPLIQIIMFGMGATLSAADFLRALRLPKAVLIGMVLQFTVMPTLGWAIATAFGFPPEVAAGVVLIGACSGGVASNVMVYLSRGNVALSVTMTACSTLLAPVMTPLAMKLLAGRLIEINFWSMMLSIINMVIIPVGGGLIANHILERKRPIGEFAKLIGPMTLLIAGGVAAASGGATALSGQAVDADALLIQTVILAIVVIVGGFLLNAFLAGNREAFDKFLPVLSMASICYILAIIAADSRDELIGVGLALLVAALIHNLAGYLLGYFLAGFAGLSESDRRTVAFEVGMQNGGMGVGLATNVLKSSAAALAPAVFGTWMNITGSTLASWWRDRPPKDGAGATAEVAEETVVA